MFTTSLLWTRKTTSKDAPPAAAPTPTDLVVLQAQCPQAAAAAAAAAVSSAGLEQQCQHTRPDVLHSVLAEVKVPDAAVDFQGIHQIPNVLITQTHVHKHDPLQVLAHIADRPNAPAPPWGQLHMLQAQRAARLALPLPAAALLLLPVRGAADAAGPVCCQPFQSFDG